MKIKACLLGILALGTAGISQENYSQWSNYRNITVNTTSSGANTTNNVLKFPLLVRIPSTDSLPGAQAGGTDIRFVKSDGVTRLKHQIEQFDNTNKVAAIWVLLDTAYGNNSTQTIRMYWGKSGVADSSNASAVFDTTNGFQGVWHLGDATNANAQDATVNNFAGTPGTTGSGGNPLDTLGIIGRAKTFRVTTFSGGAGTAGAFYSMAGTATGKLNFLEGSLYTVSAWARAYDIVNSGKIFSKGDRQYYFAKRNTGASWEFAENKAASGQNRWRLNSVANTWKYVVGVRLTSGTGSGAGAMYIDGTTSGTAFSTSGAQANITTSVFEIGRDPNQAAAGPNYYFTGAIDEVVISSVARSADWIKLSFETQKPAVTAVTVGAKLSTASAPGAPTAVLATAGNAQASVSWTAPLSDGGASITAYTVTSSPGSFTCSTTGSLNCTVTGLANGTAYTFTVTATNAGGTSAASTASSAVTPAVTVGAPDAPTGAAATAGNAQAAVSWTAATTGTAATGFTVTSNPDGKTCTTTGALTCTVTVLTNGTPYTFTVVATNSSGSSAPSAASVAVTPITVPAAPTGAVGAAGNAQVVVSWTASASTGGSAITAYTATSVQDTSKHCATTGALTCTVVGLTNGTAYSFTVTAKNAAGTSTVSTASALVTPVTVPGAPTITSVVGAAGQVTVTWTAPASTGGSVITGYKAMAASDTTKSCTTTGTLTCVVTGLTNTTSYTFTVAATNAVGRGTASAASSPVTGILPNSKELGIHITGASMLLRLPEFSGNAEVSILDVWGREVWSKSLSTGLREVSLQKSSIVPGVYIVRVTTANVGQKSKLAAESKILLTP